MSDINIKFKVKNKDCEEFLTGFIAAEPVPIDEETGNPLYTEEEWVEQHLKEYIITKYKQGLLALSQYNTNFEDIELEDI